MFVLCKFLIEDINGREKNEEEIKFLESIWRMYIFENDDEMIFLKIM